ANPVAGTSFNISGQITSDNGSGLVQRDNSVLPNANVLFSINGQPTGFTATGGAVGVDGYWNATIRLAETFAAGTHVMEATYIPNINFYVGSDNNTTFDSRTTKASHWPIKASWFPSQRPWRTPRRSKSPS
ncbi:MAG: hypothetical protein ACPHJE_02540, partial [Poseidonia sp.]